MDKEAIRTYSYRVSNASRSELIVIMYDMALEYLQDAVECNDSTEFNTNIKQAKRIVDRLSACLDMRYEISQELFKFYLVTGRMLIKAQTAMDAEIVNRVINMLEKMRKSFNEVTKYDESGSVMKNTQKVYAGLTYSKAGGSNEISSDPVSNRGFIV